MVIGVVIHGYVGTFGAQGLGPKHVQTLEKQMEKNMKSEMDTGVAQVFIGVSSNTY